MKNRPTNRVLVFLAVNSSYSHTSLAAMYLRAFSADVGFDWTTIEVVATEDFHPALQRIVELKPRVLAATFYLFNRKAVLSIFRRYRLLDPECRILAGGPEFLGENRDFLTRERCIDAAIRGEGEHAFRQLLINVDRPGSWRDIPGFCGIVNGRYVDNGMAKEITNPDDIPSPYSMPAETKPKPFIQLETSRGCRNKCAFCTSGASGGVRHFSIGRVRSDLELIRRAGFRSVRIVDRTFNENRSRCVELLRMFRQEFGDMAFHLEIDPALMGPAILKEMAAREDCGTWNVERGTWKSRVRKSRTELAEGASHVPRSPTFHLDVGVQTFGGKALKAAGRRGNVKSAIRGLKSLCGPGRVAVHADLIAGLPGATLEQTFQDLRRLVAMRPTEIQLELLKLLPGTRLSDEREKFGIVASPETPYEVLKTRDMIAGDIDSARLLCKLVDWFYEPESLREVVWQANRALPGFWQELVAFCAGKVMTEKKTNIEHSTFNIERPTQSGKPSLENRFRLMDEFLAARCSVEREALKRKTPGKASIAGATPRSHAPRSTLSRSTLHALSRALRYAWMKHGLSPAGGICEARTWKEPVPADAKLIEGDASAEVCRMFAVDIGQTYIFAYGRKDVDRRAVAVWWAQERGA